MKRTFAALAASCALLLGLHVNANANVASTFTVTPFLISEGGSSALDLLLTLSADPGYFNAQFTGGSVTLNSGIGPSQGFTILSGGPLSQDFNFGFSYPTAGNYTPSFSYIANYSEQYAYYQQTGTGSYYQSSGYWQSCGFFCGSYWVDTSHWVYYPIYGYVDYTTYGGNSYSGNGSLLVIALNDVPSATPLPAALPLFASGLGSMGLFGWWRKRKDKRKNAVAAA